MRKTIIPLCVMGAAAAVTPWQARAANLAILADVAGGPRPGVIFDANGNLLGITTNGGSNFGTVFEIAKISSGYASAPTTLVSFSPPDDANPEASLITDASGNLFGTTCGGLIPGTAFEIANTATGYATTPTTLAIFPNPAGGYANTSDPCYGLIADSNGNLFGTTQAGGANNQGTVFEIAKTAIGYASTPITLVSFNGANGASPAAGLIIDTNGNLYGTTTGGGANSAGTVFEIANSASGYSSTPTTLVSFNVVNGATPAAALVADANGNLFGTTVEGSANGLGTVFEIAKTASGYASTPTILVNFATTLTGGAANPYGGLIADSNGNLYGTTISGMDNTGHSTGTVYEITDSGFVVAPAFAGTPGNSNCIGQSVSTLAKQYGGLTSAAAALAYPSVKAMQSAIAGFCGG